MPLSEWRRRCDYLTTFIFLSRSPPPFSLLRFRWQRRDLLRAGAERANALLILAPVREAGAGEDYLEDSSSILASLSVDAKFEEATGGLGLRDIGTPSFFLFFQNI